MRNIFIALLVFSAICMATWVTPYYLGVPLNGSDNHDPEYGLSIYDLYFQRSCGFYYFQIVETHRIGATWTEPVLIPNLNPNGGWSYSPALTGSGNRMYFVSGSSNYYEASNSNIYYSNRVGGVWQPAVELPAPINTSSAENSVAVSPNGSTLYFSSNRMGGQHNYEIYRSNWTGGGWSTPERMVNLCSPLADKVCDVSSDGTKIYLERYYLNGIGDDSQHDLFVSTWSGTWGTPVPITEVNTAAYNEGGATISPGNDRIAFWSDRPVPGEPERDRIWETVVNNLDVEPASVGLIKAVYK